MDRKKRIGRSDVDKAYPASPGFTLRHALVVGDSGVGKTGLGWRLAHGSYKEQDSTHVQRFWVLDKLKTPARRRGRV